MALSAASLFDDDFDLLAIPPDGLAGMCAEPETIEPRIEAADLLHARDDGWLAGHDAGRAEGYAAGRADADATGAAAARRALAVIADAVGAAVADGARAADHASEALARVMLGMLAAAFPHACARLGEEEARAFFHTLLPGLRQEPVLTVRAAPSLLPALEAELRAGDADLRARTRLLADPALGPSDIAVTWRDGAAVRDAGAAWRAARAALVALDLLTEETHDV